jgi:hypothetical protein
MRRFWTAATSPAAGAAPDGPSRWHAQKRHHALLTDRAGTAQYVSTGRLKSRDTIQHVCCNFKLIQYVFETSLNDVNPSYDINVFVLKQRDAHFGI